MADKAAQTVRALINLGFPEARAREATTNIQDPGNVDLAVDWLLEHGEEDKGGAVRLLRCPHLGATPRPNLVPAASLTFGQPCVHGCGGSENWVCLHCGETRCGRYGAMHSMQHWKSSKAEAEAKITASEAAAGAHAFGHCLVLSLSDLSVWCYECNAYAEPQGLQAHILRMQQLKFGEGDDTGEKKLEVGSFIQADTIAAHGRLGSPSWQLPTLARVCSKRARPGYKTMLAHEYLDSEEVLQAKVAVMADMIRRSRHFVAYTGAGISTSAGIDDYATRAKDSLCEKPKSLSPWEAQPTLAHRVLVSLYRAGMLKHWVQQNHDGLPQKAGFPQSAINEIHGAWFDPTNPVVPMDGTLRQDLIEQLVEWEDRADLCFALGTSMVGMNADRIALAASKRDPGLAIVALQQTQYDHLASIRVFATIDRVMELLAQALALDVPPPPTAAGAAPPGPLVLTNLRYRPDGTRDPAGDLQLDLRPGSRLRLVNQPEWDRARNGGPECEVVASPPELGNEGHISIRVGGKHGDLRVLGRWWLEAAQEASVDCLPVVPSGEAAMAPSTTGAGQPSAGGGQPPASTGAGQSSPSCAID